MRMAIRDHIFVRAIWAAILLTAATTSVQAQYNYTTLMAPGESNTWATGISGNSIVGWVSGTNGTQGYLYNINSNTYTLFSVPGASATYAYGISDGNIVGYYASESTDYGFVYNLSSGTYTTLIDPASSEFTLALGIDGTNIVGEYISQYGYTGFIYSNGTFDSFSGPAQQSGLSGIDGTNLVGSFLDIDGFMQGFADYGSTQITLSVPGAENTDANGINGSNIVGDYSSNGGYSAFLYNINSGVYTTLNVPGAQSALAHGISGNNIVGYYTATNGTIYGFLATPVPLALQGTRGAEQFQLTVSGPAAPAVVQISSNLVNWVSAYTNTPPFTFTDAATAMFPVRFYRAALTE